MARDKPENGRTRKEKALDKLGDIVFGKKGNAVDNTAIGDEVDEFLKGHDSPKGDDDKGK